MLAERSELGILDLQVRQAEGVLDAATVADITTEAAMWTYNMGVESWDYPYPLAAAQKHVEGGYVYLISHKNTSQDIGTFALQWHDEKFWGEQPPDAGYVHRLALRRASMGLKVGEAALDWVAQRVLSEGRDFIRLDCPVSNAKLRQYYTNHGFYMRGFVEGNAGYRGVRYEKPVRGDRQD